MLNSRPTQIPTTRASDLKTLRSLLPFLWRYRGRVALALGFLVLAKAANVGIPLLLKDIVDSLDASRHAGLQLPLALLLGYGLLRLASALFNELRDAIYARVRHGAMRSVSTRVLDHLHQLSLRYHLERKTGGIVRDMERGTRAVSSLLNYMVFNILPTLIEVTMIAGILLTKYDPWFAIITFASVAVYIGFTFLITEWRMKHRVRMNQMDSLANSQAVDSLINYETVKYFGNEGHELRRYDHSLGQWEDAAVKSQTSLSALNVGQAGIIAVGVTLLMTLASQGVVDGELTIGDLVLVNAFLLQMFIPLNFLGIVYSQLKHALADLKQMFEVLETEPEIRDRPGATPLVVGDGEVRFEQVHFAYDPDRPILKGISFVIPPSRKLAVVGPSGAGKSTLARLLFRFYEVEAGRILINGQDIRDVTQASLRAAIGIVPQDTVLFNDTLYYNIAYARPEASYEEVVEAARLANIHDFIISLPKGYQTLVGERGLKLSGGEKQRVAIARAILKQPKILVFDEATSSLDSRSEQLILEALRRVAADHTTLVIAHRLSTIVDADHILVMDDGRIVEQGSHAELLESAGIYAQLWRLQQQEERGQELEAGS
ncbi:ABC transporter ATP-binding protein/permease [Thiohalobacter sp. IOR34]|uniref:ABCB family ABC transporter ATP-binding protein/permease n=1 Tax=Thiohalobacter sp. IOR34 TaxID=3057176 RepID=UPI0025AF76A9|nr:ABC transporter ATP-binding protein/permease [Thiohalobacter sp. IOR34]WJW74968.1 ABC transporter ATP-binding protein/permease [Thiohalobacter sp. IOR34]